MPQQSYNCYSVDASLMIDLADSFPTDVFQSVWDEVGRLVSEGRWNIFETVADELRNDRLRDWLNANYSAVFEFNPDINLYISALMAECQNNNMMMVNPYNTRNNADPFVVMLALYFEARDLNDLRVKTTDIRCCVLTNEIHKQHRIDIPAVCDYYDIPHMHLFDLMRYHQWQVSINVQNP
jgi:hypothetical protein